ncbi:MAG: CHAD domain-containing protein, partial [Bryobacteraceae bacterium]
IKTEPHGSLPKLAATQFGKALRRALKLGRYRHSASPKKRHQLRIALRKARYLAEFFAPVLGADTARLVKRLRRVERVLARVHDMDMAAQHLAREGPLPPQALAIYLEQQREQNLEKLDKVWRRFAAPALHQRVEHELASARQITHL